MKHCIWCRRTEQETTFDKLAHTIPKGLGGKDICSNVCDSCNEFFGKHYQGLPSVETIIKETFNISRARFLNSGGLIGKNKPLAKFSSIYFNVDFEKQKIDLKLSYKFKRGFQEGIGRQIKKGLYKMFLEEVERQKNNGHNPQYDFIREFARYNLSDYPVFYFERLFGAIIMINEWVITPKLILEPNLQFKYLVNEPGFMEFEFLGHVFGIATTRNWELLVDNYIKKSIEAKKRFFRGYKQVNQFKDIDLALSILDD